MTSLRLFVDAWRATANDLAALAEHLEPADWAKPTDLPAWTVHDVFAHCVALEAELAGDPRPRVRVDTSLPHIKGPADVYTERGVLAGRELSPEQLIEAFRDAVDRRTTQLAAGPLDDPAGKPPRTPGDIGWDWETLLRNRVIDLWVHEQDIRRAVGRPGDLDTPGARVAQESFAAALPYVVAKRAGAAPGTSVVVHIEAALPATYSVVVDDAGRGASTDQAPDHPTTRLTMSTETFTLLGAGRRDPAICEVRIVGDKELARRILAGLVLTV